MNDKSLFNWLRDKKQAWSKNSRARLTQKEVDEANSILHPEITPSVSTPDAPLASKLGPLGAIVGSLAAASLFVSIPEDEGTRFTAYKDIAGIPTICQGDTKDVILGMIETPEGCRQRLERQLVAHAKGVMACTPRLAEPGRDYVRAAAVSLGYNIGVGAYCKSSIDKYFDEGNFTE
jgi:GH24 family phage-related lysozyme (muramidase)